MRFLLYVLVVNLLLFTTACSISSDDLQGNLHNIEITEELPALQDIEDPTERAVRGAVRRLLRQISEPLDKNLSE